MSYIISYLHIYHVLYHLVLCLSEVFEALHLDPASEAHGDAMHSGAESYLIPTLKASFRGALGEPAAWLNRGLQPR